MKLILVLLVAITAIVPNLSWAQNVTRLPFASEIKSDIRHYNRANPKLATSGAPSIGAYKELSNKGVKTFIDLRNVEYVTRAARTEAESAGATYYNIPVTGSKGISQEQVAKFAEIYENADGLVLLNCGSGNRVGALWTAYQMSKGIAYSVAAEEGRTMGMKPSLENSVKARFCKEC